MNPTYGHLLETLSHGHYLFFVGVVACQAAKPYWPSHAPEPKGKHAWMDLSKP